jgi:NADH-quinone oxidoreductase subunit N
VSDYAQVLGIQSIDYAAISPVLAVAVVALAVLVAGALDLPGRVVGWLAAAGLLVGLGCVVALATGSRRATFCLGRGACSYVTDDFTLLFQGLLLGAAVVVLLLSLDEIVRSSLPAGEYLFLLLSAVSGALTLVAARDLITLVVALETLSLPVFALVALPRYDGVATEAAVKLVLVSVISTAIMLFGISLVYGVAGSMQLNQIAAALGGHHPLGDLRPVISMGSILVLAGFAFKVAAVPFHFWAPDVYQGAPLPVAAFLSVVSKAAGFAGLAIVLAIGLPSYGHVWGPVIAVLAAVTMTLGNVLALRQRDAVRLLAWSSVAQSGYMLAPLAVGNHRLPAAVTATVSYVAFYAVMNIGAFAVVAATGRLRLAEYQGLGRTNPVLASVLAFFLICLAGLPPGVMGLFAKIVVVRATVAGGVTWLGVVMGINTVIGLYYYLAWAARLFQPATSSFPRVSGRRTTGLAMALATVGAVLLSVAPQLVLQAVSALS